MVAKVIILLLAFVAAVHCSTIKKLISRRTLAPEDSTGLGIYDGTKTSIKDHPSLGAIIHQGSFFCEGTIVSPRWLITTGDCAQSFSPSEFGIIVGSEDAQKGKKYSVKKIVKHPKYGIDDFDYNYALFQINDTMKWSGNVKPVKLPKKPAKADTNMIVAGWGSTSSLHNTAVPNYTLLQGNMKWLAKTTCEATYKPFGITWTDRMACAYNKGKTTLCTGDWADPFINKGVIYGMFIAGATSGWCSSNAKPILLSDILPVTAWIKKTTGAKYEDE